MSKTTLLPAACLLALPFVSSSTAAAEESPVAVGDTAPSVELKSIDGQTVELGDVFAEGKTVLVVLRGFPGYQCPLCSRQVGEYRAKAAEFASAGARVVLVYPGGAAGLANRAEEFLSGQSLPEPLTLLLDPDYSFTDAYGLRWDAPNETAYPSSFVVAEGGEVTWAKISRSHGGRIAAAKTLKLVSE